MNLSRLPSKVPALALSLSLLFTSSVVALAAVPSSTRSAQIKLAVCQKTQSKVQSRMTHATGQLDKHFGVFKKLETRVEARLSRVQSQGKTVPNSTSLTAAVTAARSTAEAAIAKAKADTFSCTAGDPKGQLASFREDVKAAKQALHDYRVAIKNLNVAISSVAGKAGQPATGSTNSKVTR